MAKARYRYNIMLGPEPEGGYTALVPALPGCVTYGRTLEEAREMAEDAISGYIAKPAETQRPYAHGRQHPSSLARPGVCRGYPPLSRVRSSGFWKRTASSWITHPAATSFFIIFYNSVSLRRAWCL